jgi:glutamine amidotransferase
MITIVDSGVSNVRSVANMLRKAGVPAEITTDPAVVAQATKLILPGVGAFDAGMRALREHGLREVLERKVLAEKTPVLGICLGMQLLAGDSEEGQEPGLGWIDGRVVRFRFPSGTPPRKVPHMGWNVIEPRRPSPLFDGLDADARFYFVHSFHVECRRPEDVLATTSYGLPIVASVARDNVFGVQFHPEKSHRYGMALLRGFAAL